MRAEGLSDVAISFLIWDFEMYAALPERIECKLAVCSGDGTVVPMAAHLIKEFGGSPNRYFRMRNCRHTSSDARERDSA